MIANDQQLQTTLERIAWFQKQAAPAQQSSELPGFRFWLPAQTPYGYGIINRINRMNESQEGNTDPTRNPWSRLSRRVAYQNAWIVVYEDQVLRPDRLPGIYGVVHYKNRALGVVALDDRDRVLLVGQYRYPLDVYSWEIPEGGGSPEEEPLAAVQRELLEETGYSATHWQEILRAHLSNSVSDEEAVCYLATDLQAGQARPEGTELLQVRWVRFEEALAMIARREITDALSILGLQRVALMHGRTS